MSKRRPSDDGMVRNRLDGICEGRIAAGHQSDGRPIFKSVFAENQGRKRDLRLVYAHSKEEYERKLTEASRKAKEEKAS